MTRHPKRSPAWTKQEAELRKNLFAAWGGEACFPVKPCALDPQQHGEPLKRDGYTVEKITIQTRPGVRMTANLYVPDAAKKKKAAAILMVHGHWKGAKQDPTVQSRCIGAAKLGFVVLCVDAFGAGERGVGTALGEYHGDMTAATLLPLGTPLSGMQVYENMRAVDYLQSRPEVDGNNIGITGASGGGNQTMYAGAWDKRFKCVVPVCSVGNYQAYLRTACCMCEVVPGALKFTEEWAVLGMVAPRALMVINATEDGIQFSVGEARKSVAGAYSVFNLYRKPGNLRHEIFESKHDYSKPMREAMYGWMTLHLKGEGNGDPIPEPKFTTEKPEDLRCFPGDTRPKDFMTIPKYAAAEAKKLRDARPVPKTPEEARRWVDETRIVLRDKPLGGFPKGLKPETWDDNEQVGCFSLTPEPGIRLHGYSANPGPLVILLHFDGWNDEEGRSKSEGELFQQLRRAGSGSTQLGLRATLRFSPQSERVGRAPDHNSAEWGLWLGRPLLGQWVFDVRQLIDSLEQLPGDITVIGYGPAGLVALSAAATDKRITRGRRDQHACQLRHG